MTLSYLVRAGILGSLPLSDISNLFDTASLKLMDSVDMNG